MAKTRGLPRILRDLDKIRNLFDLTELGKELCDIATDGIIDNFRVELDADGVAMAPLSADYEKWKSAKFPGKKIGELFGIMGAEAEIKGTVTTSRTIAEVRYGASSGLFTTAMVEAEWFIEGNSKQNRPARDFWGITREAMVLIDEKLEETLNAKI